MTEIILIYYWLAILSGGLIALVHHYGNHISKNKKVER